MVTMLLPYINKKMNEQTKIVTILEKGIEQNIKTLVNKLNLKNKEKILQLDWTSCNGKKYTAVSKKIESVGKGDILIIVNGEKNFIDKVNIQNGTRTVEFTHDRSGTGVPHLFAAPSGSRRL